MNSNAFSAADMTTAAASGHRDGYQAGYADAVKAIEVGKPAAAQEAAWNKTKPTAEGAYYVRGLNLSQLDQYEALVQVRTHHFDGEPAPELVCNIHESTSNDGMDNWSPIVGMLEDFEWFGPLFAATTTTAAQEAVAWQSRFVGGEWGSCSREHHDLVKSVPQEWPDYEVRQLYAAPVAAAPVDDGMLPDALVPYSKEWYTLCERRFAVDKIKISGDLACAIVDAICARPTSTPAAPGIDLEQFREAVAHWKRDLYDDYKGGHIHDGGEAMRKADHLLAMIDASPKGGSFDVSLFVRDCCETERDDPDHPNTICIDVDTLTMIAQRCAEQANTNGRSETLALLKAHESALRAQVVFSDDRYDDEVKDRCAADVARTRNALLAAMQAASAEVGS